MLHQNFLLQLKRIQRSCFLPSNIIFIVVLSLILFFTHINVYAAQVDLAWSPNSESDLAGYKVYYGNSSQSYDNNIDVSNQTSYSIQNLVEGQTYYIAITAYDTSNNESGYSAEVVYNIPDTTLPSTPTNLQSTVVSTSQVDLAWNASSDNIGVTGYRIYRDSTQIATTSNTNYQDTGLSSSTTYSYTISAYDAAGNESGQSSATSATTLSLPANNPPVLSPIGNKSINEGLSLSFTISATDPDYDTLSYTTNNLPSGASFNENTRTLTWTPTYSQAGTYSNITFQVSDSKDIDSESITITVNNVNRAPVLNSISDITVNEGSAIAFSPIATDPDGGTLTYTYTGWMTSSSYTTNYNDSGTHTVTVTVSDGDLTDSQDVTVTVDDINRPPVLNSISDITVNEGAAITFSPTATDPDGGTLTYTYSGWMTSNSYITNYNDSGTHTVTVTVSDSSLSDSQVVTITVTDIDTTPPNSSISINNGAESTNSTSVTLSLSSTDNVGVTGYYISTISTTPLASNPDWVSVTATVNFNADVPYTLTSGDGTKTVYVWYKDAAGNVSNDYSDSITLITNLNVAPVLDPIADITVNEGDIVTLSPTATDQDDDTLTYTYTDWMTSSSYTTNYNDSGTHTVTVTVSDGSLTDSQDVTITVTDIDTTPPNSSISINNGAESTNSTSVTLSLSSTDNVGVTGYYLSIISTTPLTSNPEWVSVTPTVNFNADVTYTLTSGDGTKTVYVWYKDAAGNVSNDYSDSITLITNLNVAPVLDPIADITVNEGATITFSPTATDPDDDTLTYTYTGWMIINSYTTNYNDSGTHTVTVTVSDGSLSDSQVVTITVVDKDKGPLEISNLTVASGEAYEIVENGLQNGAPGYIDRSYTFTSMPSSLQGSTYIKTANDDKRSSGNSFLSFDVNHDVRVYVAHDNRISKKPSWLQSFTDTSDTIVNSDSTFGVFAKNFPAGTITLGGNEGAGNSSMYTIIIVRQGNDVDTIQPSTPANLQAQSSTNKMNLSWNASTDNVGVTGYRIYRDGIQVADVSSTIYQDTGLSKNTTYVYTVSAYDAAGNESSQSTPLVSDTKPPGKPTGMKIASN